MDKGSNSYQCCKVPPLILSLTFTDQLCWYFLIIWFYYIVTFQKSRNHWGFGQSNWTKPIYKKTNHSKMIKSVIHVVLNKTTVTWYYKMCTSIKSYFNIENLVYNLTWMQYGTKHPWYKVISFSGNQLWSLFICNFFLVLWFLFTQKTASELKLVTTNN